MKLKTLLITAVMALAVFASAAGRTQEKDIVDTAVGAGSFKTLVMLVQTAGLVDTLKGEGPFTVFAPNDAAFAKLPKATVAALLHNKGALKKVLLYHVVPGKVTASEVVNLHHAKTAEGQNVKIKVKHGTVFINKSKVLTTDIVCSNGVIHVIDTVLLPPHH